jgi:hypothetical protein
MSDLEVLESALVGLEHQRSQIDEQMGELRRQLGIRPSRVSTDGSVSSAATAPVRKRRRISAAGRRRIAEAQRKRWAALKPATAQKPTPAKKKRRISAEGRARIIAATKKRWAAFHAAKKATRAAKRSTAKTANKAA